jgi:hypothetical protein
MAVTISINVDGEPTGGTPTPARGGDEASSSAILRRLDDIDARLGELVAQMGDEIGPFPGAGIDGFLSHFIMKLQFLTGDLGGQTIAFRMPPAVQTVSRSDPFVYGGPGANHSVQVPIPRSSTLSTSVAESDFFERPADYFEVGKETVWMQILNLDARMDHPEIGKIRIILGETLKREHPDIFQPSLGVAQSLGSRGFPARLFFNPYAIIETPMGSFRAIHGTLAYGRITGFPPIGTPVTITDQVPLESTDEVRRMAAIGKAGEIKPFARLIALSHPIDVPMQIPGEEAFELVEARIAESAT